MKAGTIRRFTKVFLLTALLLVASQVVAFASTFTIRLEGYIPETLSVSVAAPRQNSSVALTDGTTGWEAGSLNLNGNMDVSHVQVSVASESGTAHLDNGRIISSAAEGNLSVVVRAR